MNLEVYYFSPAHLNRYIVRCLLKEFSYYLSYGYVGWIGMIVETGQITLCVVPKHLTENIMKHNVAFTLSYV